MPRRRDTVARAETEAEIKAIARQQLADNGTNGISLRGIARELGITAPAIYNYFPKLDDLITALLVDAFTGHALAIEGAILAESHPMQQLRAGMIAYRQWALEHPADFQLIYGNPLPGYEAPRAVTVPLASRPQELLVRCLIDAHMAGHLEIPAAYTHVPEQIAQHVSEILYAGFPEIKEIPNHLQLFYMMIVGWTRMHGITMLEIHQHVGPTIGDVESFFQNELDQYLQHIGFKEDNQM